MTVRLYPRVSTGRQVEEGHSLDAQEHRLREHAARVFPGEPVAVYREEGVSGAKSERPALTDLLADLQPGDHVLVTSLDRLGRSTRHLLELFDRFDADGIRFTSLRESIDTSTPAGRMIRTVLAAVAEFERELIAERTTAGIAQRARSGKPVGAVPFGYKVEGEDRDAVRVVCPERAAVVAEMFEAIADGASPGDVVRSLNQRGIATQRGKTWNPRGVRQLIRRDVYLGEDGYPALIEADLWRRANAALNRLDPAAVQRRKSGRTPAKPYLLRGLAHCPCGAPLYCVTGRYGGHDARHYVCRDVFESRGTCDTKPVPAANAEAAVLTHLQTFIGDLSGWLAERDAVRGREQAQREALVARERAKLADLDRRVAAAQAGYEAALDEPELAAAALRALARVEAQQEAQAGAVKDAQATAAEWTGAPDEESALAFARRLTALFADAQPATAEALNSGLVEGLSAALHGALAGITIWWLDASTLCADFDLRVVAHRESEVEGTVTPLLSVPLTTMQLPVAA